MFLQEHFHTICRRRKLPHENGEVFLQEHQLEGEQPLGGAGSVSGRSGWLRVFRSRKCSCRNIVRCLGWVAPRGRLPDSSAVMMLFGEMFLQEHCGKLPVMSPGSREDCGIFMTDLPLIHGYCALLSQVSLESWRFVVCSFHLLDYWYLS